MDSTKSVAAPSTITRNLNEMDGETGNIYESVIVISKRANQISAKLKDELNGKLEEFASFTDNLEEVFENREQIEISRHYERMPKASLLSIEEFKNNEIYFRNPADEE